jgi:GNAT superfamily N-acetyltransferase
VAPDQRPDLQGEIRVEPFAPERWDDFLRLHSDTNGAGWCRCVAWWVPTWDGWAERTAEENTALRERVCTGGEYDGLLAYRGDEPVGWCQVGPRDRLRKLVEQLQLEPDGASWAVTCFLIAPVWRRRGVASALLAAAADVARAAGATRLQGYPRVGSSLDAADAWTGTESLFTARGFTLVRPGAPRAVYAMDLG